ncbi:MAG: serine hydrolase domain-containing protein, partial [Solirubrobacteraceae bacterium]
MIVVVALLAPGGHAGTQPSVPVTVPGASQSACAHGLGSVSARRAAPVMHARRLALGGVLDATLRAVRVRVRAPAVTAAVVVCGRVVWADASGVLDLRSKRRATDGSLFVLNSAVKTIVATMIMQEVQAGHLSLGTRLSQFYPWLPNARQISVRMLLNMTSGLPDYLYDPRI